jgi:hypothetical protein
MGAPRLPPDHAALVLLQNVIVRDGTFVWGFNHAMRITATFIMIGLAWTRNRVFHSLMTLIAPGLLVSFIVIYTLRLE